MPRFTYTGDDGRYYPDLDGGVLLSSGDVLELDEQPTDGRFEPVADAPTTPGVSTTKPKAAPGAGDTPKNGS